MAVIAVNALTKRFGQTTAVQDLSFEVGEGVVAGFLGPNGAGKTTTLRVLLGLISAASGNATIGGRRYRDFAQPIRTVGAVLDGAAAHPGRSGRDHLRILARASSIPDTRADELMEYVGLAGAAQRRVGGYSLGMRQRLSLAAALLGNPRVLILDEPANGLDPQGIRWLRDLLRHRADNGGTVLVSSHILSEVDQLADEVVLIDHGKLIVQAPVAELTTGATARVRVRSPQADQLAALLTERQFQVERGEPGALAVVGQGPEAVGEIAAANGIVLHELSSAAASLEDVFFRLTAGSEQAVPDGTLASQQPASAQGSR